MFYALISTSLMDCGNEVILLFIYLTDVLFLPISGLMGANMKTRVDKSVCPWWNGPCLFEALDAIEVPLRDPNGPFRYCISDHLGPLLRSFIICLLCLKFNFFAKIEGSDLCRMPIIDKFKDMGTVVMGKVESGSVREGDSLLVMPNKVDYLFIFWVVVNCLYFTILIC